MAQRVVIPGFRKIESGGSGEGGTNNYNDLTNKPSINNVPLVGNLNTANLKLTDATLTEEGVPAEAKTVGQKLEEQSTSLIALSEQLGNHTVKSDVPENAVFTDTVYDDTDIKAEIAKKADSTAIPNKVSELTNDSNYQTADQVNSTVVTEVAKIVADAPGDFDTLKEMSDWIASHENDASAMNSAILKNKTDIETLQTDKADASDLTTHTTDTENPHSVTKAQIGLENVDNTSDADKPVSTAQQEEFDKINSNLGTLAYDEIAGGKNLANINDFKALTSNPSRYGYEWLSMKGGTYTFNVTNGNNKLYIGYKHNGEFVNPNYVNNGSKVQTITISDGDDIVIWYGEGVTENTVTRLQLEVGNVATEYEPYIPSVKMLAEENAQQNTEATDLKMLGWTTPKECPIQNHVDSDGVFYQRVGRVDMSDLSWDFNSEKVQWATSDLNNIIKSSISDDTIMPNVYSQNQPIVKTANQVWRGEEGIGVGSTGAIYYKDSNTSSNNKPTGYLYFELATEKTINVDGNEAVTKVNDSLSVIVKCKNLLKNTAETNTMNGVTFTNNGDGTYTLNGTNTSNDPFYFITNHSIYVPNKDLVILGSNNSYVGVYCNGATSTAYNCSQIIKDTDKGKTLEFGIAVKPSATLTNEIVKPMLTEYLSATYDDFVPYTGDGETLTADVAEIKNDLGGLKFALKHYENVEVDSTYNKAFIDKSLLPVDITRIMAVFVDGDNCISARRNSESNIIVTKTGDVTSLSFDLLFLYA